VCGAEGMRIQLATPEQLHFVFTRTGEGRHDSGTSIAGTVSGARTRERGSQPSVSVSAEAVGVPKTGSVLHLF